MAYIGNQPFTTAFLTDQFSGNGSTTAFTLSAAPANTNSLLVAVTGVLQDPSTYSVSGTTLTFSAAPPSGTGNISVRFLGIPASGVTTTAYRTLTEFTATAGQTTFTPPSYTVGYINVFRNGVMLGTADYTASNGTTVVLVNAATAGDLVVTESFYVSSVLNALPTSGGTLSGALIVPNFTYTGTLTGSTSVLNIGSGQIYKDASGNVGVGTSSPQRKLDVTVNDTTTAQLFLRNNNASYASGFIVYNAGGEASIFRHNGGSDTSYAGANSVNIGSVTNNVVAFIQNNTERTRIDTSGNMMWNGTNTTTSNGNVGYVYKFFGGNNNLIMPMEVGISNRYAILEFRQTGRTNSARASQISIGQNSSNQGEIQVYGSAANADVSGGVVLANGATSWSAISDIRLKTVTGTYTNALQDIAKIQAIKFTWKHDPNATPQVGVSAQSVQLVVPEAIATSRNIATPDDETDYLSVRYTELIPLMIASIQELKAELDIAKVRIAALENKA